MKRKILIFTPYFIPGFKGGGPIKSIANLIKNLSAEFDFYVITSNKDLGDKEPYKNIIADQWVRLDKCQVFYLSESFGNVQLLNLIRKLSPHIIYLNSFFSFKFSIKIVFMKKFFLLKKSQIILAPRGEFSIGALKIKQFRKFLFLRFVQIFDCYKSIYWHATSASEKNDICNVISPFLKKVFEAPNFIKKNTTRKFSKEVEKRVTSNDTKSDFIKICFISRISRKKNLDFAIKIIKKIDRPISFDIYGPIEDADYWNECKALIEELPSHQSQINYLGLISPENVRKKLSLYNILFLPTKGENFGHIIFESWSVGVPVLISDQTPWRNLKEKKLGWDFPLGNQDLFVKTLAEYRVKDLDYQEKLRMSCLNYISSGSLNMQALALTKTMFENVSDKY